MSATYCARNGFGVSASGDGTKWTATPTRYFRGTNLKHLKCWLHGRQFSTSDEAFKAMHEHGYGDLYFPRSSVPIPLFANLKHVQQQCRFDALYRYYKWCVEHSECLFPMSRQGTPLQIQRAKLRKLAEKVGIFHPVARVFNSPRATNYDSRLNRPCGPMERSLL